MPHVSERSHALDFTGRPLRNFGGNIRFSPRYCYAPTSDEEVLAILDRHANGKIRVIGSLHSWSPATVCEDAIVSLENFHTIELDHPTNDGVWATIGAGCKIKHVLNRLNAMAKVTLPSVGLITEQTIGGAIATATHGSGRNSLSHFVAEARVAAYDPHTGKPRIYVWNSGEELRAVRCSLGCMGIVLSVRIRCVPQYDIAETIVRCESVAEALASEAEFPLQQFYLVPHLWKFFVQRRRITDGPSKPRSVAAGLYRLWWFLFIDVGLHAIIKLILALTRNHRLLRIFFRDVLPRTIPQNLTVVDRAERMLVMEHELFRHLEIEIFVPETRVIDCAKFIQDILRVFDGSRPSMPEESARMLEHCGLLNEVQRRQSTYAHHYPVTFRKVIKDDAMLAPSTGTEASWYAISMITYDEDRSTFLALAAILARSTAEAFSARLHWGKYFPLDGASIVKAYPELATFRRLCESADPKGVFRNRFVTSVLFEERIAENGREPEEDKEGPSKRENGQSRERGNREKHQIPR